MHLFEPWQNNSQSHNKTKSSLICNSKNYEFKKNIKRNTRSFETYIKNFLTMNNFVRVTFCLSEKKECSNSQLP